MDGDSSDGRGSFARLPSGRSGRSGGSGDGERGDFLVRDTPWLEEDSSSDDEDNVRGDDDDDVGDNALEARHKALNAMFGFIPWKSSVSHRSLESRSRVVRKLYEPPRKVSPHKKDRLISVANVAWTVLFGWWLALVNLLLAGLLALTVIGLPYARLCFRLSGYVLWPFGKFLVDLKGGQRASVGEGAALLARGVHQESTQTPKAAFVVFCILSPFWIIPHMVAAAMCWMSVVLIPMAKANGELLKVLFTASPEDIEVSREFGGAAVVLCTYKAANKFYYKYTVGGMNVVLVNLLPFVLLTVVMSYLPRIFHGFPRLPDTIMFLICLLSTIPLTYYIGAALASISAQTSVALGAVLTASFGSIIELILYCAAILEGGLERIIQAGIVGTLLGSMLLLPGLSMIFGGIKHREQRFNPVAAGVSSVLLITSIIGAFTPTIFYQAYGQFNFKCGTCVVSEDNFSCDGCSYYSRSYDDDPHYLHNTRWVMYACAAILPFAYVVGLLFTLKTHAHIYDLPSDDSDEEGGGHGGHDGPEWSVTRCIVVLLLCTALFALVAEEMTSVVTPATEALGLNQTFVGLTLIALIPNVAEFVNAIQFALQNNMHLSIEIGSSVAVQVNLIQIPVLVGFSAIVNHAQASHSFVMIFPLLEVFGVIFAVIILNYLSIDGRANYFHGAALVIIYLLIAVAFFFVPDAPSPPTNTTFVGDMASVWAHHAVT